MTENKAINTCEFFDICETDCGGTLEDTEMCSCYELYKQLARKEQKCEEALKQLEFVRTHNTVLCSEIVQLKAENEKLKANNETWKTIDIIFDNGIAKTQISDMSLAEYSDIKLERDRAEQKLERIKEFATALCYTVMSDGVVILQKDILKIIDEVKNVM